MHHIVRSETENKVKVESSNDGLSLTIYPYENVIVTITEGDMALFQRMFKRTKELK